MPWRSRFAALQLTEADALREGPFAFYITSPLAPSARIESVETAYLSDGFEDLTGYGLDHLILPGFLVFQGPSRRPCPRAGCVAASGPRR